VRMRASMRLASMRRKRGKLISRRMTSSSISNGPWMHALRHQGQGEAEPIAYPVIVERPDERSQLVANAPEPLIKTVSGGLATEMVRNRYDKRFLHRRPLWLSANEQSPALVIRSKGQGKKVRRRCGGSRTLLRVTAP
jgi:hypothetical protein